MKFSGKVGIAKVHETRPGIFREEIVSRGCRGDLIRLTRRMNETHAAPGLTFGNTFSFIADLFTNENLMNIRYIEWRGVKWSAVNVEVQPPRLLITVGGPYHA